MNDLNLGRLRSVIPRIKSLSLLALALPFFAMAAEPSPLVCIRALGDEAKPVKISAKLEDHILKFGADKFIPIINTNALINYVRNGGRPKFGIAQFWSSEYVMRAVMDLESGPLGIRGPLNPVDGVLGRYFNSPTFWINLFLNTARANPIMRFWLDWVAVWGPFQSPFSPLKPMGPLFQNFFEGVYNVLGTPSMTGALVLGPTSANGGLQMMGLVGPDRDGLFRDEKSGQVVEEVRIKEHGVERTYRIFELLSRDFVTRQSVNWKNDTSFAVDDILEAGQQKRSFQLTNSEDQLISFLVIPSRANLANGTRNFAAGRNFDITVRSESGQIILDSRESKLVNLVQIWASKNARLIVEITDHAGNVSPVEGRFRFMVSGDPYFDMQKEGVFDTPQALPMPRL